MTATHCANLTNGYRTQRNLINRRKTFNICTVGCVSCPLSNKQLGQLLKFRATGARLPSILVREVLITLNFSSQFQLIS